MTEKQFVFKWRDLTTGTYVLQLYTLANTKYTMVQPSQPIAEIITFEDKGTNRFMVKRYSYSKLNGLQMNPLEMASLNNAFSQANKHARIEAGHHFDEVPLIVGSRARGRKKSVTI